MWEHRNLVAYQKALLAAVALDTIARQAMHLRRDLAWQLQRSSASVALNIAEGADEIAPREKTHFYRIARRSAAECDAVLDLIERTVGGDHPEARAQLLEVRALINGLIRRSTMARETAAHEPR